MSIQRIAIIAAMLCACGQAAAVEVPALGGSHVSVPVASMKALRFQSTLRQQYDFSCGSAAIATLLTYHYQLRVSEQQVFRAMYEAGDQPKIRKEGFSLLDMKRYLDANGYQADGVRATLDDLAEVAIPAILLIRENGYAHFVVIKGLRAGEVLVGDPAGGLRVYARPELEKLWTNGILFVVRGAQAVGRQNFNLAREWNARPRASTALAVARESLSNVTLLRPGRMDF